MNRALLALLLAAACGGPLPKLEEPVHPSAAAPNRTTMAAKLPKRADLPCFPCHAQLKFEKGPPFPHAISAHKNAGHCHTCHVWTGHHGREIDKSACLTCHEAGSAELARLASRDKLSN